ncbi:MAG: hypothetical protein WCH07_11680 [Deltaproteobacteria bacterium]
MMDLIVSIIASLLVMILSDKYLIWSYFYPVWPVSVKIYFRFSKDPNQPRKYFDSEALEELAASIKRHGAKDR